MTEVLMKRGIRIQIQREDHMKTEKIAIYKREETNPVNTWIWDLQLLEL